MVQMRDRSADAEDDLMAADDGHTTHSAGRQLRSRRNLYIGVIAVVVLVAGAVVALLVVRHDSSGSGDTKKATQAVKAGLAAQTRGDLVTAQQQYEQALKYNPKEKVALYDLAVIDYANANVGLAEQRYRQVLQLDPKYEPALYNLAIIVQAKGNQQEALSLYQRSVQANPADASAHFNLALMLRSMNYKADGDAQMRIALRLDPSLKDPASTPAKPKPAQPKTSNSKSNGSKSSGSGK